jgi:hypothetical protein
MDTDPPDQEGSQDPSSSPWSIGPGKIRYWQHELVYPKMWVSYLVKVNVNIAGLEPSHPGQQARLAHQGRS